MKSKLNNEVTYKNVKPNKKDYWNLFNSTGWNDEYKFTIEELDSAITNSWYAISAYLENNLIGYGRIISDGIHHALIADLIILPTFQNRGFGSEILNKLLKKCNSNNIRDIQLFSSKGKYHFYEKFGFEKRDNNAPGMDFKHN